MAEAETAIKSRLESSTANLSGAGAIWAILAPQDAVKPYLVFEVLDENPVNVMGQETVPTECTVSVSVYADTFLECVNASNDVRTVLTRYSGVADGVTVQDCFYEGRSDNYDEGDREYSRELTFRLHYNEV